MRTRPNKDLSVVLPAFNEAARIVPCLAAVSEYLSTQERDWEIILADDGSADATIARARQWKDSLPQEHAHRARFLSLPHAGKGAAAAAGVMTARGRAILLSDVDLSVPVDEWPLLRAALESGSDVAIGSRLVAGARVEVRQGIIRDAAGFLFGWLVRTFFNTGVLDTQCGFKAFSFDAARQLFRNLSTPGWCFDVEILLRARTAGLEVIEVPVRWRNDEDTRVSMRRDFPRIIGELARLRSASRESFTEFPGESRLELNHSA